MTSLRGWFISGHDIQREFFVFQLTKNAGIWNPETYIDAYNACLSITLLPTFFANVLHIPDAYVYKVLFQILFASILIIVYLIGRTWLNNQLAFLSGLFFMAFPTFFQDMPFLARQEIAFIFYGLLIYVLFEKRIELYVRQLLFMLFGVGVILSHYSSTYTVLFVLLLTGISVPFVYYFVGKFMRENIHSTSAVDFLAPGIIKERNKITLSMIGFLLVLTFIWTSFITGTGGHVREVTQGVWTAITEDSEGSKRSEDVFVFFTLGGREQQTTLESYVDTVVKDYREEVPEAYYESETYEKYEFPHVPQTKRKPTYLGTLFSVGGYSFGDMLALFGSLFAKVLQVSIPIGLIYVLFQYKWIRRVEGEYYILAVSSFVFIGLCILVPLLSREYGVFRAMQQSLLVLAPFMVIGALLLANSIIYIVEKWLSLFNLQKGKIEFRQVKIVSALLGTIFFFYATGFVGQMTGGNIPPVHLNNYGDDYSHYIVTAEESSAIHWLQKRIDTDMEDSEGEPPLIQSDRFGKKKLQSVIKTPVAGDIFPGSIRKDAYVFLGTHTVQDRVAFLGHEGTLIKYEYQIDFLIDNKELIYQDYGVRIYK